MWLSATLVVIALLVFAIARKAKPAKDQSGVNLPLPFDWDSNKTELVIATYNIQTGKSLQGKRNIKRSAHVVKQADIVGVQEVYAATWFNRLGFGKSQTDELANCGGFSAIFSATRRRWFREHRGNALLSRLPIDRWEVKMLPDYTGKSYRNMTIAQCVFQGEELIVINTHLHTKKGRQAQLTQVLQEFSLYPRAVLLGDFNSRLTEPLLKEALASEDIQDAVLLGTGERTEEQAERIDWILIKGLQVLDGMTIKKGVSDHPYYQVTVK